MPELIDKHAAYTVLKHEEETHGLSFSAEAFGKAARIIDQMPTIEAEPVRHGRWKKKNGEIYCTNCKKSKWSVSFELMLRGFNFCPKCGARMDATDTNVGGKGDEEMDLSPLDFLAAEYDRKHPQGIRFVDCMEGADDGACKKV